MSIKPTSVTTQPGNELGPVQRVIKEIAKALHLYRVHIGVMIIISFLYANKQTIDVFRAMVERPYFIELPRLILASFFALGLMPFMSWYSGRWLSMQEPLLGLREEGVLGWWLRWTPRICAVTPLGFIAWFLFTYQVENDTSFTIGSIVCIVVSVLWLIFFERRNNDDMAFLERAVKTFNGLWVSAISGLILVIILIGLTPVWFPQLVGTIPSVLLFFIVFMFCATFLSWRYEKAGIPWLSIGFLWTVLLSFSNLTDNHEIRLLEIKKGLPIQELLEKDFQNWLDARENLWEKRNSGNEYPIFIVASEGGGIYAAQNAAFTLGRLEDMSEKLGSKTPFSHNTFAISGISGGAIGATLFVSHLVDMGRKFPEKSAEDSLARILNQDLLSPIAANLFSLDYLQRFIPYPIAPDRAGALEKAIASAWLLEHNELTILNQSFSQLGAGLEQIPALILNTTEINSGRTVASAPFRFTTNPSEKNQFGNVFEGNKQRQTFREILKPRVKNQRLYQHLKECEISGSSSNKLKEYSKASDFDKAREMSVLRSAVTSARFPYVSPAGFLMRRDIQRCGNDKEFQVVYRSQYVDGGYVEASGTEPALAILKRLNDHIIWLSEHGESKYHGLHKKIKLHLVTIELGSPHKLKDASNGEISTPPMGLLATWGARSTIAREQAEDYINSFIQEEEDKPNSLKASTKQPQLATSAIGAIYRIQPFDSDGLIPLGWRLSNQTSWTLRQLLCNDEPASLQKQSIRAPFIVMKELAVMTADGNSTPEVLDNFCEKYVKN